MTCPRCSKPAIARALFCRNCGVLLRPLFTARQIGVATFLASPVAGSLLACENFRRLGKRRRAGAALLLGIGATAAQVGGLSLLPDSQLLMLAVQAGVTGIVERLAAGEFDSLRDPPMSSTPASQWGVLAAIAVAVFAFICCVVAPLVLIAAIFDATK